MIKSVLQTSKILSNNKLHDLNLLSNNKLHDLKCNIKNWSSYLKGLFIQVDAASFSWSSDLLFMLLHLFPKNESVSLFKLFKH